MPRSKKPDLLREPLSRKRLKLEIEEAIQNAQREIGKGDWKAGGACIARAELLLRGLNTMPVKMAKLRRLPSPDPKFSKSLEQGLRILVLFTEEEPVWGVSKVADELQMSRSTTHRYLQTLIGLGQLQQTTNRLYKLIEA